MMPSTTAAAKIAIHEFSEVIECIIRSYSRVSNCTLTLDSRSSIAPLGVMKFPVGSASDIWNFLLSQFLFTPVDLLCDLTICIYFHVLK